MWKLIDRYLVQIALVWFVVIFILCATPGQYIPSFSWLDLLSFDKFVHASIFYILATLIFLIGLKAQKKHIFFILFLVFCIAYGISLEMMQATIFVDRSADWADILANSFGCVLAYFLRTKMYVYYQSNLKTV